MIEDFALHDILFSDSFPKEINKCKIKDIFEILQTQERPDLTQELKKLLQVKTIAKKCIKKGSKKYNGFASHKQSLTN